MKIYHNLPKSGKRMLLGIAIILIGSRFSDISFLIAATIGLGFCIWGYFSKPEF